VGFFVYIGGEGVNTYMEKKTKIQKMRIPLPKQRCQAFKDRTKYDRKESKKGDRNSHPSFFVHNFQFSIDSPICQERKRLEFST